MAAGDPSEIHRPRVVHIAIPYLRPTETFIYDRIANHSRYEAHVLTDEPAINTDKFPIDNLHSLADESPLRRLAAKAARKLTGRLPFFEDEINRLRPAVIHAHYGPVGVALLPLRRALGVPMMVSFYGIDASAFLRDAGHMAGYAALWRECDCISVLSRNMQDALAAAGCPREKMRIHHLAVDTAKLSPEAGARAAAPPVRIACAARLVEKKGLDTLLRAVAEARKTGADVALDIAGEGPLEAKLKSEVSSLGLDDAVRFHGLLGRKKTLSLMRRAHIAALLSRTAPDGDAEGTPTALMEAGALGLPCVSTIHAGIPEVVEHGQTGLLVPENDVAAAARALCMLAADAAMRERLGAAARVKIESEFSIGKVIAQIESDYDEISKR